MRKKILTILLILFCVGSYSQNDTIADQKLGFKIIFKSKPELYTQNSDSQLGKVNFYRYDLTNEANFYRLSIGEFAEIKSKLSDQETNALLIGFKKGFLNSYVKQNKECRFTSENRFKFKNKYDGLELLGKIDGQIDFKMNVIVKGPIVYTTLIIGQIENNDAEFFINSFDFLEPQTN